MATLLVEGLQKHYGGLVVLDSCSFHANEGSIVGLIGPNGAGKSTVFNAITGLVRPDGGRVYLDGADITGLPAHRISQMGIQRTYQNIRLFGRLTVQDNVAAGFLPRHGGSLRRARQRAAALLAEVDYDGPLDRLPGQLPYAFQRRVEIARALAGEPRVLLLDEPAAGMHARERDELAVLINRLVERGLTTVLIEHDIALVSRLCHHVVVMDFGCVIALGTPGEIRDDPRVVEAYLGGVE